MTSRELLAAVRQAQGLPSNYALARVLGIRDNTLQRWHAEAGAPDDAMAARLATMARLDPDAVVAAMHAQRAGDDEERARWQRIARRLEVTAALAVCAVLSLFVGGGPDGGATLALGLLAVLPFDGSAFYTLCAVAAALPIGAALANRAVLSWRERPPTHCGLLIGA